MAETSPNRPDFARSLATMILLAIAGASACAAPRGSRTAPVAAIDPITLVACQPPRTTIEMQCGVATVPEDRTRPGGKALRLAIIVVPSRSATPDTVPVYFIAGGPGQTVTEMAWGIEQSRYRDDRAIVLLDQRGTSADQRLDCAGIMGRRDLQSYFEPVFGGELMARCRAELETRADLTQYTTSAAVDDLESVRAALGHQAINLVGVSYGTRLALAYMRRYPTTVRAAVLTGVVPPAFRNPLHHAAAAQEALDGVLADCLAASQCRAAFPNIRAELDSVVARLRRGPVRLSITDPWTGAVETITFDAEDLAESTRLLLYRAGTGRRLPLLIHRAAHGEFRDLADAALRANRSIRIGLRFGMLMSVVCSEDIPRITEDDIVAETRGTLLGDARVRQQMAACREWPSGPVTEADRAPFVLDIPTLLVSGTRDPVTPARWGEETRRHLASARHVVIAGAHGVHSGCVVAMGNQLMRTGSIATVDTNCIAAQRYGDFIVR